jgi:hypothetical protein
MEHIEVRFVELTSTNGFAYIAPDGTKIIGISNTLVGAPSGYLNALEGHERVHLKGNNGYFLFDNWSLQEDIKKLLKKYKFSELEKKLENPDNSYPYPMNKLYAEYEVTKELINFHRQCADLIAYYEGKDEETKNWILLSYFIGDEVIDFIKQNSKKKDI